jgi:hypothetical protein
MLGNAAANPNQNRSGNRNPDPNPNSLLHCSSRLRPQTAPAKRLCNRRWTRCNRQTCHRQEPGLEPGTGTRAQVTIHTGFAAVDPRLAERPAGAEEALPQGGAALFLGVSHFGAKAEVAALLTKRAEIIENSDD